MYWLIAAMMTIQIRQRTIFLLNSGDKDGNTSKVRVRGNRSDILSGYATVTCIIPQHQLAFRFLASVREYDPLSSNMLTQVYYLVLYPAQTK